MLDVPVVTREVGTSSPLFEHGGLLRDDVFGYAGSVDRRNGPAHRAFPARSEPQIDQTPRESPGEGCMRGPKEAVKGHKQTHHLDLLGLVHWPTKGADPVRGKASVP